MKNQLGKNPTFRNPRENYLIGDHQQTPKTSKQTFIKKNGSPSTYTKCNKIKKIDK